jgi:hypothetical protein
MSRKFVTSSSILLLSFLFMLLLWEQAVLLSLLLILTAYVKHKIYPIKRELLWFLIISIGSALIEIILVNFGHTWVYSAPHFFGIPIQMPLSWGIVGTTVIVMYEELSNN